MVDWLDGPGTSAGAAMEDAASALDIMDAMRVRDNSALKAASMKLTRTLGNQLPGVLPTPDPDLNRALRAVTTASSWIRLSRLSRIRRQPSRRTHSKTRVSDFVSTLGTLGWTYDRDGEIIDAAGR